MKKIGKNIVRHTRICRNRNLKLELKSIAEGSKCILLTIVLLLPTHLVVAVVGGDVIIVIITMIMMAIMIVIKLFYGVSEELKPCSYTVSPIKPEAFFPYFNPIKNAPPGGTCSFALVRVAPVGLSDVRRTPAPKTRIAPSEGRQGSSRSSSPARKYHVKGL